ncbi:mitochondrial hypoxia responsive domain-containing protein [Xylaria cf. heliscus]|nr:mitochondrial hypoxia responsive domain-containing protein [Xylaria cf. heliscus]
MADRPFPSSFDENKEYQETAFQKIARKLREEPLIPLGTILTCAALYNAWRAMRQGDHARVQRMFRARIGAQAFTVVAMVAGGAYYGADREKRKELIKLEAQKRAEERNQKWLHELEVRDEEDRKLQAAMKRKRDRLEQKRAEDAARDGKPVEPSVATASTGTTTTADAPSQQKAGGSGVLGALSDVGGWFGTKKGPAEKGPAEKGPAEKGPVEKGPAEKGPVEKDKTDAEVPKK